MLATLNAATEVVPFDTPENTSDWRIVPRLIKVVHGLIKGILSVVALGISFVEAICNPGVSTWILFAYEVVNFFFPWVFRSLHPGQFFWLDLLSSLVSLVMMLV